MAALEYLTQNSLTSHPFKNSFEPEEGSSAVDGWFYDILFVSYDDSIRRVYLQKIEKKPDGSIEIGISNSETLSRLPDGAVTIPAADVVDHYANKDKSFVGISKEKFSIKFVLGPTLVNKEAFLENYLPEVTELSSDVIILNTVRVDSITFEAYDGPNLNTVKSYSGEDIALVEPRYNSTFILTSISSGALNVSAGSGAGLYDNCPVAGDITDVYTLGEVPPNSEGSLFLSATACHSINLLTVNDELIYGDQLDAYRAFTSPGNAEPFNAVNPNHTITLENFCSAKCPHENINALAYYINRVTDGASGLADISSRHKETRGIGSTDGAIFHVDSADFCNSAANIFLKCSADSESFVPCNEKFVKYLHEGRTLQALFDNATISSYTIISVIDDNNILLDGVPPPIAGKIPFRVVDNGVISNINCASSLYNEQADANLNPYYKLTYSTSEAFNSDFEYVTYVAVSVGVFNPGKTAVRINVIFNSGGLGQQGSFKIRKADSINISSESAVDLYCKEYAFIEAIYYIKCGQPASNFSVLVKDITTTPHKVLGDGAYVLPPLVGVSCPGDVAGTINRIQILKQETSEFSQTIGVDPLVKAAKVYGTLPDWLDISFQPAPDDQSNASLILTGTKPATDLDNFEYNLYVRYTGIAIPVVSQIIIHYVAPPVFLFPTEQYYTQENPLAIDPQITYTDENPLIQLTAKNVNRPLSWNGNNFGYYDIDVSTEQLIPYGLTLHTGTGKITGRLLEPVPDEGYWKLSLIAANPAGMTFQDFYLGVTKRNLPVISFLTQLPTEINNYVTYTIEAPLCSFKATNEPILIYQTPDKLPLGLILDFKTGAVYGKLAEPVSGTKTFRVYARNFYGKSLLPVEVVVTYTIYKKPEIQYPTQLSRFNGEDGSTLEEPLFTIMATQAFGGEDNFDPLLTNQTRNHYTATNLPPGFSVDLYTGKVYGVLDTSDGFSRAYAVRLIASNLVASVYRQVYITFPNVKLPVITNIAQGTIFKVIRNIEYTAQENPLALVYAIYLNPTIFAVGLPAGLTCLSSGAVVGLVNSSVPAGDYTVLFRAQNRYGVSSPAISCIFRVGVELLSPLPNSTIYLLLNRQITPVAVTASQGVPLTITMRSLPTGLTYSSGQISGTPLVTGKFKAYITVSAGVFGLVRAVINIFVSIPTFSISGEVSTGATGATGATGGVTSTPLEGVYLTAVNIETGKINSAKTSNAGNYQFTNLIAGTYNVSASKSRYEILPITKTVTITDQNLTAQNFTTTGPYRLISGRVYDANTETPIGGVAIIHISRTVYTDPAGRFFINLLQSENVTITADTESYVFNPKTIQIPSSNKDTGGYIFNGLPAYNISGRIISKNTTVPTNVGILVHNQNDGEKYYDIAHDGIISAQALAGKYKIYPNPTGSDYYNSSWLFKPEYVPVELIDTAAALKKSFSIFSGKTISGRIIAPIYETEIGLPIPVSDASITATNIVLDETRFIWLELDVNNPPNIKLNLKTIRAVAASTENIPVVIDMLNGFFNLRGVEVGQLTMDGYAATQTEIILLKDQFYPELNGIYTVVDPGSETTVFSIIRSTEANSPELLKVGSAIYVTGGTVNGNSTYYLTTEDQVTATSDIDGYFTLSKVYPDIYKLYLHKDGMGLLDIPPVNVSVNNVTGLVIVPNTYQVTGTIQYRANYESTEYLPLSDVRISLYRAKDLFLLKKSEKSKQDGSWIFRSIPDGDYVLKAEFRGMTSTVVERKITVDDGDVNLVDLKVYISTLSAPSIPVISDIIGGYRSLKIIVSENLTDLGPEIRYYQYSLDLGVTWLTAENPSTNTVIVPDVPPGEKTTFFLRAVNLHGAGNATSELQGVSFDRPLPPTIVDIDRKNKELLVYFSPPVNSGGLYIDNYDYSTDGGETFVPILPAITEGPFSILKRSNNGLPLVNGTDYQIVLRALAGEAAGLSSAHYVASPAGTPSSPRLLSVVGGRLNELDISFEPPELNNGAPVSDYTYSLNGGAFINLGTTQSPVTINNLNNGSVYSVSLAAINAEGVGDVSNTLNARVGTLPNPPTITKAVQAGGGKLKIYIESAGDGFSPITGYVYYIDSEDGGTVNSNTATPLSNLAIDNTAVIYKKLIGQGGDNGTLFEESKLYAVSIAAINEFGTSIKSEKMIFSVVYTTPRPLIINSYVVEYDSVVFTLSFEDNDPGGAGGFVGIAHTATDPDGVVLQGNMLYYDIFERTEYQYTVGGLTTGIAYDILLETYNAEGSGE